MKSTVLPCQPVPDDDKLRHEKCRYNSEEHACSFKNDLLQVRPECPSTALISARHLTKSDSKSRLGHGQVSKIMPPSPPDVLNMMPAHPK